MVIVANAGTNQLKTSHIGNIKMNTFGKKHNNVFGLNTYLIVVGEDTYQFQGYQHQLTDFMRELSWELGYDGFYKKDVKIYTI